MNARGWALALGLATLAGCSAPFKGMPPARTAGSEFARPTAGCPESTHVARTDSLLATAPLEEPVVRTKVDPVYPNIAREAGVEGVVVVRALVCEHGRVIETRVLRGPPMLKDNAESAVKLWRFDPARSNDAPIPAWTEVEVPFTLH